jgi:hypothetical protein
VCHKHVHLIIMKNMQNRNHLSHAVEKLAKGSKRFTKVRDIKHEKIHLNLRYRF